MAYKLFYEYFENVLSVICVPLLAHIHCVLYKQPYNFDSVGKGVNKMQFLFAGKHTFHTILVIKYNFRIVNRVSRRL